MDFEKTYDDTMKILADILPHLLTGALSGLFLLASGVMIFFGGLVAYIELFPNKADRVVKATIKGVRSRIDDNGNPLNYPVFEYVDTDGDTKMAESLSGSSSLADKIPGTQVRIRLSGSKQGWATQLGMSGLILGFGFFLFGWLLGYIAIVIIATLNPTTYLMWALVLLHFGNKVRKIIIPKSLRETKDAWKTRRLKEDNTDRQSMPMMGRAEVKQKLGQE